MSHQAGTPPRDVESLEDKKSLNEGGLPVLHATNSKEGDLANFSYDREAESRLRRKIDLHIVAPVALVYLFCFIDRANIGNARIAGLEKDLGMNPRSYQYNILLTSFYIAYVIFEIPSTLLTKILGPGRWIPAMTFIFGVLSLANAFVKDFGQAVAVRFLLGVAEAGMLPSVAFYLARWYRKDELALRCAYYIVMAPGAGAFGGLLASGILKIERIPGVQHWGQIFFVEGIITIAISVLAWFTITNDIESARWLSPEEKELARNRMLSEQVGKKNLIDSARTRSVIRGIFAPTSLVCATMFFFDNVTVQGIAFFLPSIVRVLFPGRTVIQQQLLTVPPNVFGAFWVIFIAWLTTKFKVRGPLVAITSLVTATGYVMYIASKSTDTKTRYAASFLATVGAYAHGALVPAWASINTNNDSERAGAIGAVVLLGNLGGLAATWTYLPKHAPNQIPGNSVNLAGALYITIASTCLVLWQRRMNARGQSGKRDHEIDGLTQDQIDELGSRHPRFLYRY